MEKQAKRDFGSFHSSNVQELIKLPEGIYCPPVFPVELPTFAESVEFGAPMKEKHFFLDRSWTFLNHGAFGAVLKEALHVGQSWQVYCEYQPLAFIDRELLPHLVYVCRRLAKFVDADPTDLVFVPNATTGINTVVQSVIKTFQPGSSILTLNLAYGATKKLLKHLAVECNIRVDEVEIIFPLQSAGEIVKLVQASLRADTRLAIFDHIPSNYGIILPVKELVDVCHMSEVTLASALNYSGIEVLIDGAHALGALPISMRDIGADYYVSNAHKWLCSPKGCAFLYVAKHFQVNIRPLVVSHGFGAGFNAEFVWTGLRDYSPFLALHTVLDFWEKYGVENIRRYIHDVAQNAAAMLQQAWNTRLLADKNMFGAMVLVALPKGIVSGQTFYNYDNAEVVQNILHHEFKIEVPIKVIDSELYVRISSHVYNELEEYSKLAEAVLKLVGRAKC